MSAEVIVLAEYFKTSTNMCKVATDVTFQVNKPKENLRRGGRGASERTRTKRADRAGLVVPPCRRLCQGQRRALLVTLPIPARASLPHNVSFPCYFLLLFRRTYITTPLPRASTTTLTPLQRWIFKRVRAFAQPRRSTRHHL